MAKTPKNLALNEEQFNVWMERIQRSRRSREDEELRWEKLREFYKGNYYTEADSTDRVSGFWTLVAIRQMMSALYHQDVMMNFTGRTASGVKVAQIMETVASYERKLIGAAPQEKDALKNALLYNTGVLKFAFNTEFGMEPAFSDSKSKRSAAFKNMSGSDGIDAAHEDIVVKQGGWTEHNPNILFGHPWIKSVHPRNFFVDPDALSYDEARWVAERFYRPWIEAVNDERWDDEARKNLDATGHSPWVEDETGNANWMDSPVGQDTAMVEFFEIYDKTTQRIIVVSQGSPKPLEVKDYPFFGKDGPYEILQFLPRDDSFWAISYADTFSDQVLAMNKLRTQMMDHFQKWGSLKLAIKNGAMDLKDAEKWINAHNAVAVVNTQTNLEDVFSVAPQIDISGDAWRLTDLIKSDFEQISGISEQALGSGAGVQTATEANIIAQQSGLRISDMRDQVDQMLRGSTRKIVALLRQFWTSEQIVPIVGPDGQTWDVVVDKNTVAGEYDVDIESGSTERVDRNARMRQTIELLQTLGPMQQLLIAQGHAINFPELLKTMLRNTDVVKNPDRIIFALQPQQAVAGPQLAAGGQVAGGQPSATGVVQTQSPQPAPVNALDQLTTTTDAFATGRQLSEAQG